MSPDTKPRKKVVRLCRCNAAVKCGMGFHQLLFPATPAIVLSLLDSRIRRVRWCDGAMHSVFGGPSEVGVEERDAMPVT